MTGRTVRDEGRDPAEHLRARLTFAIGEGHRSRSSSEATDLGQIDLATRTVAHWHI